MCIDVNASLGDLAIEDPRRTKVFADFGLDYCCHGHVSLAQAVTESELDIETVRAALTIPGPAPSDEARDRAQSALAHDIVDTHHAYMWEEMPRLRELVDKVAQVHGASHPELAEVQTTYTAAIAALDPHMTMEERVVFPAISRIKKAGVAAPPGSFSEPIQQLRDEHEVVGELFAQLRSLTGGYVVPEDACTSYRLMLEGLAHMERDLHEHIHKENNILFPRVLEFERQGSDAS